MAMSQQVASYGRGGDKLIIHVRPDELQGLASMLTITINPETGMLINLKVLSKILKEEILDKVDHKNLNLDVPFLEGIITTTENVTIKFWEILDKKLKSLENSNCTLHKIRLYETPRNFVEYYGEK